MKLKFSVMVAFGVILLSPKIFAFHPGGDVRFYNASSHLLTKVRASSNMAFSVPTTVSPGETANIYAELNFDLHRSGPRTVSVEYQVKCPDNQIDTFRITIQQNESQYNLGKVIVLPVTQEPHCIDLSRNLNLEWHWNQTPNYSPPMVVIY